MTARELLADLTRRGIRLVAHGDRLRCYPKAAVGPELLAMLREHKAELLAMLESPPAWPDPSASDLANARLAVDAFSPLAPPEPPTAGQCRCGSMDWQDVAVHGGASLRRDCAACGRFAFFPLWHGKRFDN